MKLKRGIPLIDQHDQHGFWGGKFGGSFIPETLKKPVEDLTNEFKKLRKDKKFIKKRDHYFKNYIGAPTSFVKLDNLYCFHNFVQYNLRFSDLSWNHLTPFHLNECCNSLDLLQRLCNLYSDQPTAVH